MKYLRQFSVILLIAFLGEGLHSLIPLPIPSGIYGLILMFFALLSGIVPLSAVRETGHFLTDILLVLLFPAAVGLSDSWTILQPIWLKVLAILVISTLAVMCAAGRTAQRFLKK